MLLIVVLCLLTVGALHVLRKRHAQRLVQAEHLEETAPTEHDIKEAFRETEAPQMRPYHGGEFGNDSAGNHFIADKNGAVRRVAIVETQDGQAALLAYRKLPKGERKKRKKLIRAHRAAESYRSSLAPAEAMAQEN